MRNNCTKCLGQQSPHTRNGSQQTLETSKVSFCLFLFSSQEEYHNDLAERCSVMKENKLTIPGKRCRGLLGMKGEDLWNSLVYACLP